MGSRKNAEPELGSSLRRPSLTPVDATVLIVDDDADIRSSLRMVLREEGFRVREASNGLEGLERIADEEPDLVMLDLMMPVINGWEVLQTLRKCREHLPIVILSALPPHGHGEYLQKPVSLERLLAVLDTVRERLKDRIARAGDPPPKE
jgi:DNA-binding response OmpR family regulator